MKFKMAEAQTLLRKLHEKQAGLMLPLVAGAAVVGGAHTVGQGLKKGHEYKQGFQPPGVSQ